MNKCKKCDKKITKLKYKLCGSCAAIERWKSIKKSDRFCVDCKQKLSRKDAHRCKQCYDKYRKKII